MGQQLMAKKRGMIQIFDEKGNKVVCTVLHVEPSVVTQVKTVKKDGYDAVQLGYDEIIVKDKRTISNRVTKPLRGHFEKAQVAPRKKMYEIEPEEGRNYSLGEAIGLTAFDGVSHIDVIARSKGKGFQGVMKRHNFAGMRASHGTGPTHRHGGSTGMRSTPGRCFLGTKMAGRMGNEQVTVENLRIVSLDAAEGVMLVEGAVPGPNNGYVMLRSAKKKITVN